jgi:hypothetical protein
METLAVIMMLHAAILMRGVHEPHVTGHEFTHAELWPESEQIHSGEGVRAAPDFGAERN